MTSSTTSPNSLPIGSAISTVSRSSAEATGCPARSPRTNTSSATGNCSCIRRRTRLALAWRNINGTTPPISADIVTTSSSRPGLIAIPLPTISNSSARNSTTGRRVRISSTRAGAMFIWVAITNRSSRPPIPAIEGGSEAAKLPVPRRRMVRVSPRDRPLSIILSRALIARLSVRRETKNDTSASTPNNTAPNTQTRNTAFTQVGFMRRTLRRGGTGREAGRCRGCRPGRRSAVGCRTPRTDRALHGWRRSRSA